VQDCNLTDCGSPKVLFPIPRNWVEDKVSTTDRPYMTDRLAGSRENKQISFLHFTSSAPLGMRGGIHEVMRFLATCARGRGRGATNARERRGENRILRATMGAINSAWQCASSKTRKQSRNLVQYWDKYTRLCRVWPAGFNNNQQVDGMRLNMSGNDTERRLVRFPEHTTPLQ